MSHFMHALAAALVAVGVAGVPARCAAGDAPAYRLGPEDHLALKVWDLRNGDPYQWQALTGEFVVGADGALSLPLVGSVKAGGETVEALAAQIGAALQAKVGLSSRPDASVQVLKYRPFFVTGAVDHPGRFEYLPGLTVLQAVSVAGGLIRSNSSDLATFQRQAIAARGDMRVLDAERDALLARSARLAAEIGDAQTVTYPTALIDRAADPLVAQAMKEENLLFAAERDALHTQITAIETSKAVIRTEISSLAAKDATLDRQLDLNRKDLSQVSDLVTKGVAVMPRQLAAEQSVASLESAKLDVQIAGSKAQQDLAQADRDIVELRAKFRTGIVSEASDVRAKLDANAQRARTAQGLVRQAEAAAPGLTEPGVDPVAVYSVLRAADGTTAPAGEGDVLMPGDVLRVSIPPSHLDAAPASVADLRPVAVDPPPAAAAPAARAASSAAAQPDAAPEASPAISATAQPAAAPGPAAPETRTASSADAQPVPAAVPLPPEHRPSPDAGARHAKARAQKSP